MQQTREPPAPSGNAGGLIDALRQADAYPHPVGEVELIETHISWLLLTGEYAYKLKKPVDLGFLDFSTLAKRRQACEQELRLNRRLAPALYLAVVPVRGTPCAPRVGAGDGPVLEYAVRMQQFDPAQGFDRLLHRDALPPALLDELAVRIARFHQSCPRAGPDQPWGTPDEVRAPIMHNFPAIEPALHSPAERTHLAELQEWTERELERRHRLLAQRRAAGRVRECHGDLHLGNVVLHRGHPLVFDCIEFNPALRWIDVISEVAFTTMDLDHRGRPDLGGRFLNLYLEYSGDYAGLALLRLYRVYRALVRAKVAAIRAGQQTAGAAPDGPATELQRHLDLASHYTRPSRPLLVITHGLSGAGKTTWTNQLVEQLPGAFRVRSDVERKRLHGLEPLASSGPDSHIYTPQASQQTYARLLELADGLLRDGYTAIVEATFLQTSGRAVFQALADRLGAGYRILDFRASPQTLEARVARRRRDGGDASEAGLEVLRKQFGTDQPFTDAERPSVITLDSERRPHTGPLAERLLAAAGRRA